MSFHFYLRLLLVALLSVPVILLLIVGMDVPLAKLQHDYGAPLQPFFLSFMRLHDGLMSVFWPLVVWPALLLLFSVARWRRWPHSTIWLVALLTLIASQGIVNMLKMYFHRPRPLTVLGELVSDAGFWQAEGQLDSFPSNHAAVAAGLLLPWALRFPKARPWLLTWLGLVCLGRVVLEFHWLSDVVAGAALGLLLTCAFELATWWLRPKLVAGSNNLLSS
ncbi:phosphatase PAP2 family protein [Hymenobacter psychrophilus]|uniref:PAP2 superfamily protein n=1 Tax=Hymenobacter psychrophilus TaxID=651662 RepID=A0A1H3GU98_9BACT|nr:phosphatase PAP2 family protein [Hymenobacter psychrophilus]SDY06902.1 PAP2 superfamily protein [Hymenobacter psychrophilus]